MNITKVFVKLVDSKYLANDAIIVDNKLISCGSKYVVVYQYEIFHKYIIQNENIYSYLCYVKLDTDAIAESTLCDGYDIIKTNNVKIINIVNIFENTTLSYHVIKHNIELFKYVKCESSHLLHYAIQVKPELILNVINPPINLIKIAISLDPNLILKMIDVDKEIIIFALKTKPDLLSTLESIDRNIIETVINYNANNITYINNKIILELLNTNNITIDISKCLSQDQINYLQITGNSEKLLKINGLLLEKIKEPTLNEIRLAINQNTDSIQYVCDINQIINIIKEDPNYILKLNKLHLTNTAIVQYLVSNIKKNEYNKEILQYILKNDIKYINVILCSYGIEYLDYAYIYHKNILSGFTKITKDILLIGHKHSDQSIMFITPDRLSFEEFNSAITENRHIFLILLNKYFWNYYLNLNINILSKIFTENKKYFENYLSFLINYKEIILGKYFELIKISPNLINLVLILCKIGKFNLFELIVKSINVNRECEKYASSITDDISLLQEITNTYDSFYKYYSHEVKCKLNTTQILKKNIRNIQYVPPVLISDEVISLVKSTLLYELYIYLPHNKLLHQEKLCMLKKDINLFRFMSEQDKNQYASEAVKIDGNQLKHISMPDMNTCVEALINTELAINYIPDSLKSYVMQKYHETNSYKLKNFSNKFKNLFSN